MIRGSAQQQGKVVVWAERARTLALCVLAVLVAASFGLLFGVGPAHAATFTVNSTGDVGDNNIGNGSCFTGTSVQVGRGFEQECTLRAAIQETNVNSQVDTINFHSGLSGTITLSLGELVIANDSSTVASELIIEGPGARTLTVSGNDASRVFKISEHANVTISGLTISDGYAANSLGGGGIFNDGWLTLTNSTVSGNTTSNTTSGPAIGYGGGIYNSGRLTLTNSTVNGNTAIGIGGGIFNLNIVELTNSTVSNNTADGGGGIYDDGQILVLSSTTVSSNTATEFGGGGILTSRSPGLRDTIIARNSAPDGSDAQGRFDSLGHNLIGNTTGSSGWISSDLENVNPLLGPLQNNGGPTNTHALKKGSPAINTIPKNIYGCGTRITTDQRGLKRPQGKKCDIGSFEKKQRRR